MSFMKTLPKGVFLPIAIFLLGVVSGSILLIPGWKRTQQVAYFVSTPEFLVWTALASILFGILPLCAIYGVLSIQRLKQWKYLKSSFLPLSVLLILFFMPPILMAQFPRVFPAVNLPSFEIRVNVITLLAGLSLVPAATSLVLMSKSIENLTPGKPNFPKEYLRLKEQLEILPGIIGLVIGLGTLTTGGLQNALTALYQEIGADLDGAFPPILTVLYGSYFTTILLIMYLSLSRSLTALAKSFIELHVKLPELSSDLWIPEYEKYKQAEEWLQLSNSWVNLRSSLAILTPLIGGLMSYVIPK